MAAVSLPTLPCWLCRAHRSHADGRTSNSSDDLDHGLMLAAVRQVKLLSYVLIALSRQQLLH